MKRLYSDLESTTPLVNSDFNDILQEQHKIAYSAYLDGLNDMPFSPTQSTNRGIILSGIEIDATLTTPNIITDTQADKILPKMNWTVTINKSTALIYFDGEYYSPSNNLLGNDLNTTEVILEFNSAYSLIFYPFTQSLQRTSSNEVYRSSNRAFNDGITKSMTIDYRFEIIRKLPSSQLGFGVDIDQIFYEDRIPSTLNVYPGSTQGVPYVYCSVGGTSRNLSRLLRYANAVKDDVYISHKPKRYLLSNSNLTDDDGGTIVDEYIYRDFGLKFFSYKVQTAFEIGRNELKGFAGLTAMAGRFMVGYDTNSTTIPQNAGLLQFNYKTPGNIGGTQGVTFSFSQLPTHNHGTFTDTPPSTFNFDHTHPFNGAMPVFTDSQFIMFDEDADSDGVGLARRDIEGLLNTDNNLSNFTSPDLFLTRNVPISDNPIKDHYHEISSVGLDEPHENRPPYTVVVYYYKI